MAILGSKSPNLGSKMVPSHPFAALPFIGFFMGFLGFLGLGIWDFWGFFHPIDLCRVKVRYFGANLGNFGVKICNFGAENGRFWCLFAAIRRRCVYRVFYGVFGAENMGFLGFFPPHRFV